MEDNTQDLSKKERQELKKEEKINRQLAEQRKKRLTSVLLWSFITIFVGGTIAIMVAMASKNPGTNFVGGSVRAADETDWIKGAPLQDGGQQVGDTKSQVTLIEYSDFQCPACGAYYPLVKQLVKDFPNLAVVYRHFPLQQHGNARIAAQAAEAAGMQGKFWEMHDLLFDGQRFWSEEKNAKDIFNTYAEKLGLNLEKFKADFDSSEVKNNIEADVQSGTAQIDGTPTFFLNNQKIQNPQSYEQFRGIIQQANNS